LSLRSAINSTGGRCAVGGVADDFVRSPTNADERVRGLKPPPLPNSAGQSAAPEKFCQRRDYRTVAQQNTSTMPAWAKRPWAEG